jgi:hypothetical protein
MRALSTAAFWAATLAVGLQGGGLGVVVVLLGDGVDLDQALVALGLQLGGRGGGLGLGQAGGGAVVGGLIGGRVDLVQRLSGADIRAFLEQAGLDDAADLRAHFRDQIGRGAAGQFGGQGDRLGLGDDDADRRRAARAHAAAGRPCLGRRPPGLGRWPPGRPPTGRRENGRRTCRNPRSDRASQAFSLDDALMVTNMRMNVHSQRGWT